MLELVVRGGQIVTSSGVYEGDIGIQDGKIAVIAARNIKLDALKVIDAVGKIIMPGFIDVHVHHRTQVAGLTTIDTPTEVSQLAAYGGITTMVFYIGARWNIQQPDAKISSTPEDYYGRVIDQESRSLVVDFGIHCMLFPDKVLVEGIPAVTKMGIKSFKMVLGYNPRRGWLLDDYLILSALETIASINGLAMFHCENGHVIGYLEDKFTAQGTYNIDTFLKSRPSLAEAESVYRITCLAEMMGCPAYIVHLSSKEGLEQIIQAQIQGKDVVAETCPQYLLLNDEHVRKQGALLKMAPPIRLADDNAAIWKGIQAGYIDFVGSDQASFSKSQKTEAINFSAVPFGIPGIETIAPLIYSEGVAKGRITLSRMAQVLAENPAKKFGLYPRKGAIQVGADADLVFIDPEIEWEMKKETLHSKCGYTPYEGWKIKGKPVTSLIRGNILLEDGKLHQSPGFGRYLFR